MNTKQLLAILPVTQLVGKLPEEVTDLTTDSRAIAAGGMFVCIEGHTVDGHKYVTQAVNAGARVIIASKPIEVNLEQVAVVYVDNTSRAISILASCWCGYPSKRMKMIGVTGTNGKTSVSNIIHEILMKVGEQSAVSGTIGFNLDGT